MFGSFLDNCSVATSAICHKLHEATGWDGTHLKWNIGRRRKFVVSGYSRGNPRYARNGEPEGYCELSVNTHSVGDGIIEVATVPAYDLGYLLRGVPPTIPSGPGERGLFELGLSDAGRWHAGYSAGSNSPATHADIPEDAVALLCIAMAERGLVPNRP